MVSNVWLLALCLGAGPATPDGHAKPAQTPAAHLIRTQRAWGHAEMTGSRAGRAKEAALDDAKRDAVHDVLDQLSMGVALQNEVNELVEAEILENAAAYVRSYQVSTSQSDTTSGAEEIDLWTVTLKDVDVDVDALQVDIDRLVQMAARKEHPRVAVDFAVQGPRVKSGEQPAHIPERVVADMTRLGWAVGPMPKADPHAAFDARTDSELLLHGTVEWHWDPTGHSILIRNHLQIEELPSHRVISKSREEWMQTGADDPAVALSQFFRSTYDLAWRELELGRIDWAGNYSCRKTPCIEP
jgi:hypothetical protein